MNRRRRRRNRGRRRTIVILIVGRDCDCKRQSVFVVGLDATEIKQPLLSQQG